MSFPSNNFRLWSMYKFLMQIHKAKRDYYVDGTSKLTDYEYDCMERSFKTLHSTRRYKLYVKVGYIDGMYEKYKTKFEQINRR